MISKKDITQVIRLLKGVEMAFIDLFCGAGGTSSGIERAYVDTKKVARVILCINHDALAIESHTQNHPHAIHLVEDVRLVKMQTLIPLVTAVRKAYPDIKLCLWASLECTNFSKAKGGQARDADSRSLAWDLLRYIDCVKPDKIYIENVEEFMSWGPLDDKNRPMSKHAGEDYVKWIDSVQQRMYSYAYQIINSADLGAVQSRKRYFAQFAAPGQLIRWPEITHVKVTKKGVGDKLPWRPVRSVLNLDHIGKSIFERAKDMVPATLERLYAGIIRHVLPENPHFFVKYFGTGENAVSIDTASPTLTTKDRLALIKAQFIDKQYSGDANHQSINSPAGSLTTNPKLNLVTCQPFIMNGNTSTGPCKDINDPAPTITCARTHYLINPQWFNSGGISIDKPSPTLIARMDKAPLSLATTEIENPVMVSVIWTMRKKPKPVIKTQSGNLIYIISYFDTPAMQKLKILMACTGIVDIKMRMLEIEELLRIQGFPDNYVLKGTKTKQKWFIGNAVEVNTARSIIEANSNFVNSTV